MRTERRWLNEVFLILIVFVALAWTLDVMAEGAEPASRGNTDRRSIASVESHASQSRLWVHPRQKELWYGQNLTLSSPGVLAPAYRTKRLSVLGGEFTSSPSYETPLKLHSGIGR